MASPTYAQIARLAGVGTATVERVLNGRGGVRPATAERVLAAARTLDYPRRLPELHRGITRIEVLLVRPETTFFERLAEAFARASAALDPVLSVHRTFVPEANADEIVARILRPPFRRAGLICAVPNHPAIRAALGRLRGEACPVVQVVTRASDGVGDFVGIDHRAAGRTAALLLSRMQPRGGPVIALCHSGAYEAHRQRIRGFGDYLAEGRRPDLPFVRVLFGRDEGQRSGDLVLEAMRLWPDLAGIYNAGGANTSVAAALRERGARAFFVGHELTPRSASALRSGAMDAVLDQAPEEQARRAMEMMLWRLGFTDQEVPNPPIRFVTILAENIGPEA